jgi:hypothetical protein
MFAVLHSDINSLKSGVPYLTGQPYCKKSRLAKVKDGIINLILRNYLFDQYKYSGPECHTPTTHCHKHPGLEAYLSGLTLIEYKTRVSKSGDIFQLPGANFIKLFTP